MQRYALVYGGLAGLIVIGSVILGLIVNPNGVGSSQLFGYLIMLLALSLIYVGVRRYRDQELGGIITFPRALLLGAAMAGAAGLIYVALWELYLALSGYDFMAAYSASVMEQKRAAGLDKAALADEAARLEAMRKAYANPLIRLPMTFAEIVPIALLVALVSAALLRTRRREKPA
ncbi:MAG: DUF4199 domain-containing protein [Rhodothalassiaceae bacterium]